MMVKFLIGGKNPENRARAGGYMPQRDLLLSVARVGWDNVLIPLEIQGIPRRESRQKAMEMLPHFGWKTFESEYPSALSGGMRQRAAL